MKSFALVLVLGFAALATSPAAHAETSPPASGAQDPAHDELRALLKEMVGAVDRWDLDALVAHMHPQVVVTWPDATTSKTPAAVKAYLLAKTTGPGKILESFKTAVDVDELTRFYASGTVGVAFGSSLDQFKLTSGSEITIPDRWTATLVKEDGRWQIASFHSSADIFDNPLTAASRKVALAIGLCGILVSFVGGVLVARLLASRRAAAPARV